MNVRDSEKIKSKMTVMLDAQQVGYLVFGALVVAGLVFAMGFAIGQRTAVLTPPAALAEVACLEVLDDAGVMAASSVPFSEPPLGYERRLHTVEGPAAPDDPALRLLADERDDLLMPGMEPVEEVLDPDTLVAAAPAAPAADSPTPEAPVAPAPEVAPPVVAAAPEPAPAPAGKARFTLQVQAFRTAEDAAAFSVFLRGRGYDPFVQENTMPDKGTWHRVRVGRFADQASAVAFQRRFERAEGIDTFVTALR